MEAQAAELVANPYISNKEFNQTIKNIIDNIISDKEIDSLIEQSPEQRQAYSAKINQDIEYGYAKRAIINAIRIIDNLNNNKSEVKLYSLTAIASSHASAESASAIDGYGLTGPPTCLAEAMRRRVNKLPKYPRIFVRKIAKIIYNYNDSNISVIQQQENIKGESTRKQLLKVLFHGIMRNKLLFSIRSYILR